MANNINGNAPNAVVAKQTISFLDAGITSANTHIIYKVGNPLKSYMPGRAINGISGFEVNNGYYIVAKQDMDLEAYVAPPLEDVAPLNALVDSDGSQLTDSDGSILTDA